MQRNLWIKCLLFVFFSVTSFIGTTTVLSCTRLLHIDPNQGVMVGRNMDWYEEMQTKLLVYPRGMAKHGYDPVNPLKWISQYGSIVATSYDAGTTDGMNEKGLAGHVLWLDETDYGRRDQTLPGLSVLMWLQFYLDNFKTVDEAIRFTQANHFQVLPYFHPGTERWIKLHWALEDASGDSAIIEYQDGIAKIYHSTDYTVLTNSPFFNQQLDNMKQYDGFGGNKPLPGTNESPDRFVRAAYHGMHLPTASTSKESVAGLLSVLHNVSAPFTPVPSHSSQVHRTIWRTIADLTHHVYYFNSTPNFTVVYAQLDQFNLQLGAPVMKLDLVKRPDLSGDISSEFEPVK